MKKYAKNQDAANRPRSLTFPGKAGKVKFLRPLMVWKGAEIKRKRLCRLSDGKVIHSSAAPRSVSAIARKETP